VASKSAEPQVRYRIGELRSLVRPFHLHWFPRLNSTNDHAAAMRKRRELFAPAILLTGHQLAGRGRGSNTWWSGPGTITVTFAVAASDTVEPHQVPLLAGLAVRNAAAELTGDATIQLKWPNDLLFEGRKLAGLLCERIERLDLIGLGINVNVAPTEPPRPLRDRVSSLSQIVHQPVDQGMALATISRHLHATLSRNGDRTFRQALVEYHRHHALVGRKVTISRIPGDARVSGICRGMDSLGRLLVQQGSEKRAIIAGHVDICT
jgi:BirA family biotin operon repressor/biotin-[acetyl-CoA-carboxylase] ligase